MGHQPPTEQEQTATYRHDLLDNTRENACELAGNVVYYHPYGCHVDVR
jgi:hypothetical protein